MAPPNNDSLAAEEVKILLKGILDQLKTIGVHLAQQGERIDSIEQLGLSLDNFSLRDFDRKFGQNDSFFRSPNMATCGPEISKEARSRSLLDEALRRYKSNDVPYWSTLYGTHLKDEEHPEIPEEVIRNSEWTSLTADCWKIPHDNRVSFCFLSPPSDPTILIKVRNFLSLFHRPDNLETGKGKDFNIWDWFDTGISAYWCPGNKAPEFIQKATQQFTGGGSETQHSSSLVISHLVAPWRRIINLRGLTTLSNCEDSIIREDLGPCDLCPFLFSDSSETIFHQPTAEMLRRAVKCHLSCQRTSESQHAELQTKDCILFHITFFEILEPYLGRRKVELWPCGELHSDTQSHNKKPRQVRESALTIFTIPSSELPGSSLRSIFWTMVCLRPTRFPLLDYSEKIDDLERGNTHEMINEMSGFVHKGVLAVVSRWEQIAEYCDQILSERKGLFDPEYHDSLLTDDGIFSRSKKYFWAIGFLEEVGNSISDNILQLKRFVELMRTNAPTSENPGRDFQLSIKKHHTTLQKLQLLKIRFLNKKAEAMALRDGLFSASAVMESRASTHLGENIKLLTFVSIFFLPLTFCTSLWSINDTLFSLSAFAIVIPIVSIFTYTIVLNLDNIAWLLKPTSQLSLLQKFVKYQIDGMQKDEDIVWKERGASLSNLKAAHRGKGYPSRWRLLHFAVSQLSVKRWLFSPIIRTLSRTLRSWGERKDNKPNGEEVPVSSLGDLGNIHVRVEVDVESRHESERSAA